FKLAMYAQPFLLGSVCLLAWSRHRTRYVFLALLGGVMVGNAWTQLEGVELHRTRGFTEIFNASRARILDRFQHSLARRASDWIVCDTTSQVLCKYEMAYVRHRKAQWSIQFMFLQLLEFCLSPNPELQRCYAEAYDALSSKPGKQGTFLLHGPEGRADFEIPPFHGLEKASPLTTLIVSSPWSQSVFNRRVKQGLPRDDYLVRPLKDVQNHLFFVDSKLGKNYIFDREDAAFCQMESDLAYPGDCFCSLGRFSLFRVLNPSPAPRLVLNLTRTYSADRDVFLTTGVVIGNQRVPIPAARRGGGPGFPAPRRAAVRGRRPVPGHRLPDPGGAVPTQEVRHPEPVRQGNRLRPPPHRRLGAGRVAHRRRRVPAAAAA